MASPHQTINIVSKAVNVSGSILLALFVGAIFSVGIFEPYIRGSFPILAGVWASSIAFSSLVAVPVIIIASLYLTCTGSEAEHQKTVKIRILVALSSLGFLGLSIAAVGVQAMKISRVRLGISMLGVPIGILYMVSLEILIAWFPQHPGLGVGLCMTGFGLGPVVFSEIFDAIIKAVDVVSAARLSSLGFTVSTLAFVPFVRLPLAVEYVPMEDEADAKLTLEGEKIEPQTLPFLRDFWLYMIAVFAAQVDFALLPYYFEMGADYNVSHSTIVRSFQVSNIGAALARLGVGALTEYVGSMRLTAILLFLQTALFGLFAIAAAMRSFAGFFFIALSILVSYSGLTCASAMLARDMFGTTNSTIVFCIGAGITMGLGEFFATWFIGTLEASVPHTNGPSRFNAFFALSAFISLVGAASIICASRCSAAFPTEQKAQASEPIYSEATSRAASKQSSSLV